MCSGRAAWTVVPEMVTSINLETVTARIEADGWDCTLRNRLCCTFSGEADITLYPSGKLLVKSGERDVAQRIATHHIQVWLANEVSEEFEIPDVIIERVKGGLPIVYPTSTLPALGCIPEVDALDQLFTFKNREETKVVSLGVATLEQANQLVNIPDEATTILDAFPPGSLTLILPAHEQLDSRLGGSNVAIRVLSDPRARALIEKTGPLTATSANLSGQNPLDDCVEAARQLGLPDDAAISAICVGGAPSTLIAWNISAHPSNVPNWTVVREGKVTKEAIEEWSMKQT